MNPENDKHFCFCCQPWVAADNASAYLFHACACFNEHHQQTNKQQKFTENSRKDGGLNEQCRLDRKEQIACRLSMDITICKAGELVEVMSSSSSSSYCTGLTLYSSSWFFYKPFSRIGTDLMKPVLQSQPLSILLFFSLPYSAFSGTLFAFFFILSANRAHTVTKILHWGIPLFGRQLWQQSEKKKLLCQQSFPRLTSSLVQTQ